MRQKQFFKNLLITNEEILMEKVLKYAILHNYTKYTSTLKEAWRISIQGITQSIEKALEIMFDDFEFNPDMKFDNDCVCEFGTIEAKRHRTRGITIEMFLGLFKYYRQAYLDLIEEQPELTFENKNFYLLFINRIFDRIELSFCKEWSGHSDKDLLFELQNKNRIMTNEKNKYLTIFESLLDPVFFIDNDGFIINMNYKAALFFFNIKLQGGIYYSENNQKLRLDWLEKETLFFLNDPEKYNYNFVKEYIANNESHYFDVRMSKMLDVSLKFNGITLIAKNITIQKNYEKDLYDARLKADSANKLKSDFLANMSHEIRTPMNAIIGFTDLMIEDKTITKEQRDNLTIIKESGNYLLNLINDILDFSKIESDKIEIVENKFCLNKFLNHLYSLFLIKSREKSIFFNKILHQNTAVIVKGDDFRINQILTNILGNAFKFTEKGEIIFSCKYENNKAVITISDTGIGIPQEKFNDIFDSFKQADSSISRKYGGTGLGLSISKRLIDLMNGEIMVSSELNKGTEFTIILPLIEAKDNILDYCNEACFDYDCKTREIIITEDSGEKMIGQWIDNLKKEYGKHDIFDKIKKIMFESITQLPHKISELKSAIINKETAAIKFISHDIKGTYSNFLIEPIKNYAMQIEIEIKKDDPDFNKIDSIFKELNNLVNKIPKKYFKSEQINSDNFNQINKNYKKKPILVVEDNIMNQKLMCAILKNSDIDFDIADNGKKALDLMKTKKYKLIFMDIQMPEMDGITALKEIRNNPDSYNIPVIALTARALKEDKEKFISMGFDGYMAKPIVKEQLNDYIIKYLKK
ncbi:response regulator [Candidatus Dependentiae bacterium]|nr:response regulator [Candidatus Dependentiae bacterium]